MTIVANTYLTFSAIGNREDLEDVQRYAPKEQHDDITLIVAKCKG